MTYYVGGSQQFAHAERDAGGGLLPQQAGRWRVSNPAVADITDAGLAHWLAAGETEIVFVLPDYKKAGMLHAVVLPAAPATLIANPTAVTVFAGAEAPLSFTAEDADGNPVADFAIESLIADDPATASVIRLSGTDALVVGRVDGSTTITATSGAASLTVDVTVAASSFLSEADADARYRRLGILIQDSEVAKTPAVPLGDVSGAVALSWTRATRAHSMRLVGNTVATLSGLPVGEFAFLDVIQDDVGGHTFHLVIDGSLPPQEWDGPGEPEQSSGPNRRDSYMAYNEDTDVVCSRTWTNIPTL